MVSFGMQERVLIVRCFGWAAWRRHASAAAVAFILCVIQVSQINLQGTDFNFLGTINHLPMEVVHLGPFLRLPVFLLSCSS